MNINVLQWMLTDEGTYVRYTLSGVEQEPVSFPHKIFAMADVIKAVDEYHRSVK